ncbi:MAG: hypothetical protein ACRD51_14545 [Candidatus Acidiferrum sp.]
MIAKKVCGALVAFAGLILMVPGAVPTRADDGCNILVEATKKEMTSPSHIYSTTTAAYLHGKTETGEVIYAGGPDGAIFVRILGKWKRSPVNAAAMLKQEEENRRAAKMTCHYLRAEAVNGETAAVYSVHTETEDAEVDSTIWISKSKGLPLKQELDMDMGGTMGKSHKSMRCEYTNVKPPQV